MGVKIVVGFLFTVQLLGLVLGDIVLESQPTTNWGAWGPFQNCSLVGAYVVAFQLKTEEDQGIFEDDTALNSIRFYCNDPRNPGEYSETFTSTEGEWGTWGDIFSCGFAEGDMAGFQLRTEEYQGDSDDTATNNLRIRCENHANPEVYLEGDGETWGEWRETQLCPAGHKLCGLQTQVEPNQGDDDDTSLNNIRVKCCDFSQLEEEIKTQA